MDSALAADRARLEDIDTQISVLERSLSALREQRAHVQERLDAYTYPVMTLPAEITSDIFTHFLPALPAYPPLIGSHSPTLLTQICRGWREIALAIPRLWSAISFADDWYDASFGELLHICHIWLTRSHSYPLAIRFGDLNELDATQILAAITPHRERWEYLDVHLSPSHLPAIQDPMPLLRHLNLSMYDVLDDAIPIQAPLLHSVALRALTPPGFAFPEQLTSLVLMYTFRSDYAAILQRTCNLVHCELGVEINFDPPPSIASSSYGWSR
ncbi:hypothetical protein K438DRAFT_2001022 [Mycena galopus ATCC 62051]|nr:hypothetical protein K438DRAFT_2001022 [Mycena galopus ATCC 62051]